MATCADIIKAAYRRAGVVGSKVPLSEDQAAIGLEQLQGMYQEMSNGLFGQVIDYYLSGGNYTASEQQRIYKNTTGSVITIPPTVTDADTGLTRAPLDGAMIVVVDPALVVNKPTIWLYNAAIAKWQSIVDLALTDVAPLSYQFEEPLRNILAAIVADENNLPVTSIIARRAGLGKLAIANRRQQASRVSSAEYF